VIVVYRMHASFPHPQCVGDVALLMNVMTDIPALQVQEVQWIVHANRLTDLSAECRKHRGMYLHQVHKKYITKVHIYSHVNV
jgi:hypothetical protein